MKKILFLSIVICTNFANYCSSQNPVLRLSNCSLEAESTLDIKGDKIFVLEHEIASNVWAKVETKKSTSSKVIFSNLQRYGVYRASQLNGLSQASKVRKKNNSDTPSSILYSNSLELRKEKNCSDLKDKIQNNNASLFSNYNIFPNPTSSEINIVSSTAINFWVEIYGSSGMLALKLTRGQDFMRFSSENLIPGMYFVKIIDASGSSYISKLIIED